MFLKNLANSLVLLFGLLLPVFSQAQTIPDDPNRFVTFYGSNSYVAIDDNVQQGLDISGDRTIQCRVRFNSDFSLSNSFAITKEAGASGPRDPLYIGIEDHRTDTNQPQAVLATFVPNPDPTGANEIKGIVVIPTPVTGQWNEYTWVYHAAGGSFDMFVDGKLIDSFGGLGTSIYDSVGQFKIGGPGFTFDGSLDGCAIWNVALTPNQVKKGMKKIKRGDPGLVSYWPFDGSGADVTPTNNTLQPFGGAMFN